MPGNIFPGQVSHEVISAMDLYPTFERLATTPKARDPFYVPPPKQETRKMDGIDIWPQLLGLSTSKDNKPLTPLIDQRPIFFYCNEKLLAIRAGKYKVRWKNEIRIRKQDPEKRCASFEFCLSRMFAFFELRIFEFRFLNWLSSYAFRIFKSFSAHPWSRPFPEIIQPSDLNNL